MATPYDVTLLALTMGMNDAEIVAWHCAPGDRVAEGDVLLEVDTGKVLAEIESPVAGVVVELVAQPGSEVDVGSVLCRIDSAAPATAPSHPAT